MRHVCVSMRHAPRVCEHAARAPGRAGSGGAAHGPQRAVSGSWARTATEAATPSTATVAEAAVRGDDGQAESGARHVALAAQSASRDSTPDSASRGGLPRTRTATPRPIVCVRLTRCAHRKSTIILRGPVVFWSVPLSMIQSAARASQARTVMPSPSPWRSPSPWQSRSRSRSRRAPSTIATAGGGAGAQGASRAAAAAAHPQRRAAAAAARRSNSNTKESITRETALCRCQRFTLSSDRGTQCAPTRSCVVQESGRECT